MDIEGLVEGPQKGKHLYYRCSERVYCYPLPRKCFEKGVNARIADDLVWNRVSDFMTSPELIEEQMNLWAKDKQSKKVTSTSSLDNLKQELEKIKKEEQRYIRVYGAELINFQQFEEAMKDLKIRRETLENQIKLLIEQEKEYAVVLPDSAIIQEFCDSASYILSELEFEPKQAILRKTVEKVIANQLWMDVTGYLPIGKEVELCAESRHSWITKCGEEYVV